MPYLPLYRLEDAAALLTDSRCLITRVLHCVVRRRIATLRYWVKVLVQCFQLDTIDVNLHPMSLEIAASRGIGEAKNAVVAGEDINA